MTPPMLAELASHAEALPSLPEVVNHLMRTLKDENADIDTLAHHINADPAILARLLAAANSAASGLSTRIYSAKQAFLVLGADRVTNIILASALSYRYDTRSSGFDTRLLWRHSLGTAICTQVLAEEVGVDPALAFTGGLLHDIGQLLMFVASPPNYVQAPRTSPPPGRPLADRRRTLAVRLRPRRRRSRAGAVLEAAGRSRRSHRRAPRAR